MNEDVTDMVLIDVSELDLDDWLPEPGDPRLDTALDWVLSRNTDGDCNSFQSCMP